MRKKLKKIDCKSYGIYSKEDKGDKENNENRENNTYFKLTASMLRAPGQVPPEILSENRELIENTLPKLEEAIKKLNEAKTALATQNKTADQNKAANFDIVADNIGLSYDFRGYYDDMINENLDEKSLTKLENDLIEKINGMQEGSDTYEATTSVLSEIETYHKASIVEEIKKQLTDIQEIVKKYDEREAKRKELSSKDSSKRQLALKIARRKVESLQYTGINEIVSSGNQESQIIIEKAKGILLSELTATRDQDKNNLEKALSQEPDSREQMEITLKKLEDVIKELNGAKSDFSSQNQGNNFDIVANRIGLSYNFKGYYDDMINGNLDEKSLMKLESDLREKMAGMQEHKESDEYKAITSILSEIETHHKTALLEEIKGQLEDIQKVVKEYDDKEESSDKELSPEESRKRESALKIAKKGIASLEKTKMYDIIENGSLESKSSIEKAEGVVLSELVNARNQNKRKMERVFKDENGQER